MSATQHRCLRISPREPIQRAPASARSTLNDTSKRPFRALRLSPSGHRHLRKLPLHGTRRLYHKHNDLRKQVQSGVSQSRWYALSRTGNLGPPVTTQCRNIRQHQPYLSTYQPNSIRYLRSHGNKPLVHATLADHSGQRSVPPTDTPWVGDGGARWDTVGGSTR